MPPGSPGFGSQMPSVGTNGMAIASLVLGISSIPLCFLFVPAILAVIFGLVAFNQIKGSGQSGKGMAIAGLILGGVSIGFIVLAMIVGRTDFQMDTGVLTMWC